jgi:hypothetical protein
MTGIEGYVRLSAERSNVPLTVQDEAALLFVAGLL